MADQHMRRPPAAPQPQQQPQNAPEPLYPDTTFTHDWSAEVGDERIVARHHGRAHTSGDAVITFERANVVHMGDLMFNRRHPVVDRPAGASLRNWARLLPQVVDAHARDTIYVFGHAGTGLPVTGGSADLLQFRDYLAALVAHVEKQVQAGKSRDEVLAMREPLAGFEAFGAFGQANPRDPLSVAYDEVTTGA
jgi:glyoxylase-like metal-dependent hydrolase (beta-lactamase superfamily II)